MIVQQEHISRLITVKPSAFNVEPIPRFLARAPNASVKGFHNNRGILCDTAVLFGGGRKWRLTTHQQGALYNNPLKYIVLAHQKQVEVDLFALSTSFIVWLNDYSKGIELHYSCVNSHIVRMNEKGSLELCVRVLNNGIFHNNDNLDFRPDFVEFVFTPIYGEFERYVNDDIENLFTYENFGLNKGDKMVISTYNAIGKCAALHLRDDSLDEASMMADTQMDRYGRGGYAQTGNADSMDYNSYNGGNCDVASGAVIHDFHRGTVRSRGEDYNEMSPKKRVKC